MSDTCHAAEKGASRRLTQTNSAELSIGTNTVVQVNLQDQEGQQRVPVIQLLGGERECERQAQSPQSYLLTVGELRKWPCVRGTCRRPGVRRLNSHAKNHERLRVKMRDWNYRKNSLPRLFISGLMYL